VLRDNRRMKVQGLSGLKTVKRALAERAATAARLAAEAAQQAAEHQRQREADEGRLFLRAIGAVQPLADPGRRHARPQPPSPLPRQRQRDEQAVMQEALSDAFDAETLLHTDEHLSYRRAGLGPDVVRKLRQGHWALQGELDLHGLRLDQAREALGLFLRDAHKKGLRCVRVVHGKGLGSPGKTPVLKGRVQSWLVQKREVMAFVQARPMEGGAGALVVLLQPAAHRSG